MPYATIDDILGIYGEQALQNVAPLTEADEPDPVKVAIALNRASAEVDAYLSGRYVVPLAVVSQHLVQITVDIAMYRMPLSLAQQTSEHRSRYDSAIQYLRDAAAGKAGIGTGSEDEDAGSPGPDSRTVRTAFLFRA